MSVARAWWLTTKRSTAASKLEIVAPITAL
jgi:hypothetical protein